jgi:hypothetical protein
VGVVDLRGFSGNVHARSTPNPRANQLAQPENHPTTKALTTTLPKKKLNLSKGTATVIPAIFGGK